MQTILNCLLVIGLLASPALASAGIKGTYVSSTASTKGGLKAPVEYSSPAVKGKLLAAAAVAPQAPVVPILSPASIATLPVPQAGPVVVSQVRAAAKNVPLSVENREWLIKQDQILHQQHESLENTQRELKQTEEQQRIEQNRQIDEQHLLEPAVATSIQQTKGGASNNPEYVRPARIEASGKTSQRLEETKGGAQIKQEIEEHRLEPLIEQQKIEQQQLEEQLPFQRAEGAEAEPYSFSYDIDGQSRAESGDKRGVVRGYYKLASADGQSRLVEYIADAQGFRAVVKTNEFGTEARSPAHVALHSSQPLAQDLARAADQQQQQILRSPPTKGVALSGLVQSSIQVQEQHSALPLPVRLLEAPIVQTTTHEAREERKGGERVQHSPLSTSQQQLQRDDDDQVQLVRTGSAERGGKSLELAQASPIDRNFVSATAHKPPIQASPVSHRSAKSESAPVQPAYNSDESHNGFDN